MKKILRSIALVDFDWRTVESLFSYRSDLYMMFGDEDVYMVAFYDSKSEKIYFFDEDAPENAMYIEVRCSYNRGSRRTAKMLYNKIIWQIYKRTGWDHPELHMVDVERGEWEYV